MNAKDLKTDSALGGHINDGSTKYAQSGSSHQNISNKSYQDMGANAMGKVDVPTSRPCAIIGPDRVIPSQNCNDGYMKKTPAEPWPCLDNLYRQSSEYTHKISEYQPMRNISPRQTFQENMQRIMVSPYSSVKKSDDPNLPVDRNVAMLKDVKLNMPMEAKYCEVPYSVNPACNEQKSVRVADMRVTNGNPGTTRSTSHAWPHNNINVRPLRPYGVPELYQYPDYPSCTGPRAVPMVRPQRIVHDEPGRMYQEPYYPDANIRFRPYPPTKGRYPHGRYEYISNYSNTFQPSPPFPPQAYDSQKSMPSHSYPLYPQGPLKFIDRRTGEPIMDGYQRSNPPQGNINLNYHNPIIHPPYGPLQTNCVQNNIFSYPPENPPKAVSLNKLPYTNNGKIYADYEILQNKKIPISETVYANDVNRIHTMKGEVAYPNYAPVNVHGIPHHTIYRRENISLKNFEFMPHLKNLEHPVNFRNQLLRHPIHFSPNSIAISPSDSNTSNDASQTHGSSQEDCGYVSQSSTNSGRSIDLHLNGIPNEHHLYRSPDRYGFLPRNIQAQNHNNNKNLKVKKDINVRQFLQMWNEGDDELGDQSKDNNTVKDTKNLNSMPSQYESANKQEQLYVLGLVNVPSEELDKYDHIQKISKLPENIKGYNNIELLNQFEEVIESTNIRGLSKTQRVPLAKQIVKTIPRPVSPLDVEAKISQSVIHKEVGCNFEIKPCSPKMLNVEIAAPVENILEERIIEKVSNPITAQTITVPKTEKINIEGSNFSSTGSVVINNNCGKSLSEVSTAPSCNMDSLKYQNDNSLDLEYNSSVCLASLPRLDNEIELNFPEINQQFINANKIESITPIAFKESTKIDSGELDGNIQYEKAGQMAEFSKCSPNRESDKEFTKLSKYRKLKKTEPDPKNMPHKSVVLDPINKTQFRTDSVIIKNPENVKLLELNLPSNIRNADNNRIMDSSIEINQHDKTTSDVIKDNILVNTRSPSTYNIKENTPDAENAIDFSINKIDTGLQHNCQKESIVNDSFLNFIEENLNIPDSYENTKSEMNTNNQPFDVESNDKVRATADATVNNNINYSSNDKQECEETKGEDLRLNNNLVKENNKEISEDIQLGLNYSSNSESISTDIEMAGDKSLSTILHNLNDSCLNNSGNEIPEIRQQGEDKSKASTEFAISDDKNEIHKNNYPTSNINLEFGNINHENDSDKMTNETCEIFNKESDLITLNLQTNSASNFDSKDVESSLVSLIDSNVHTLEKELNIDCEYKTCEDTNILPDLQPELYKSVPEKKFNKRLHSSIILNLMVYNDENPKEKNASQIQSSVVTHNDDNMKRTKCIIQSTYLEENSPLNLDCKTLATEIFTASPDSFESVDIGSTENVLVSKQFYIEMSDTLTHKNNMELINEESCANTNNNLSVDDSEKSCTNSENNTEVIATNTANNLCHGCPEKIDSPDEKSGHLTIKDNKMLLSDQIKSIEIAENQVDNFSFKEVTNIPEPIHSQRTVRLKRSFSDSALNIFANEDSNNSSAYYNIPKKRKKVNPCELMEPNVIAQNLCNIIQTNRRNSISTVYNEESVSFCILIDNSCDLIDENACGQKISLAEIIEDEFEDEFKDGDVMSTESRSIVLFTGDSSNEITNEDLDTNTKNEAVAAQSAPENGFTCENTINERNEDKNCDETWIEDVACIETVFSDDITEDIALDPPLTPKETHELDCDSESDVHNGSLIYNDIDHMNKLKYMYGNEMCNDDVDLVETLYRTPQMDLRKTLNRRESQYSEESTRYYDNDSLEKILSESNYKEENTSDSEGDKLKANIACSDTIHSKNKRDDKENLEYELPLQNSFDYKPDYPDSDCYDEQQKSLDNNAEQTQYDLVHSCESTCDYTTPFKNTCESPRYSNSSSPEVSSTTSEEKSCAILLKITNCNGSISAKLNDFNNKNSEKSISVSPEKRETISYNCNPTRSRPLITKAAQKYIPPLKESIPDLKVKLPLPKHSLNKLKTLKISKDKPKPDKNVSKTNSSLQKQYPKKNKPKFEDVLKSIDEIHIKMHKEKNKKQKHSIPKVVIKKNENGAHYTSTSNDVEAYNPDLTGRKWQPWVFIEKNYFIDKMALNKKAKAVFNYRKNTYVLAEKFRKYKSVHNANFVISQPKIEDISSGKLKYTIRLKHNY